MKSAWKLLPAIELRVEGVGFLPEPGAGGFHASPNLSTALLVALRDRRVARGSHPRVSPHDRLGPRPYSIQLVPVHPPGYECKTGYTDAAKHCLLFEAVHHRTTLIGVVQSSPTTGTDPAVQAPT